MRIPRPWVLLLVATLVGALPRRSTAAPEPQSAEPEQRIATRARNLSQKLRCPVCQGLSVADSQAESAVAMRDRIEEMVREGWTDEEIVAWFVDRYGTWVLLEPPAKGLGWFVWLGPALLFVVGAGIVAVRVRRSGSAASAPGAPHREPDLDMDPETGPETDPDTGADSDAAWRRRVLDELDEAP